MAGAFSVHGSNKSRTGANATTERAVFAALRSPQTEGKCHEYLTEAARDRGAFDRHVDDSRFGSICRDWLANYRVRLADGRGL